MKFIFVTLFPDLVEPYFSNSILSRAKDDEFIHVEFINPRDFSTDKHKKVDDYKAGGGAGLLMSPQPLFDALNHIREKHSDAYFIFPTPVAKEFKQHDAKRLSKKNVIVFVCGRYEGIDERVVETFANELFSIGDFILTGGELPALCLCDAISRMVEGVLGNEESLVEESFEDNLLEAPSFTKPNIFQDLSFPSVFLKGNHSRIASFKNSMANAKTKFHRPTLYKIVKTKAFNKD
ncbi:MAG: tRNA (guanosine(37)-N1)-methyltransferase TrmD [Campylobacteraceae bacterium]